VTVLKTDRLDHLLEKLEPAYGRIELQSGDALEQVLWTILARHGSRERATKALAAIRAFFADLNEMRVGKAIDLAEVIHPFVEGNAVDVARKLRGFLRKVFDDKNVLGFDFGREMDRETLRRYLSTLPDFGPELQVAVLLKLRPDESELVGDPHATRVAIRTGVAPQGTGPARLKKSLEEELPDRATAVRALFALAAHGGAVCQSKAPLCGECALGSWCPSYDAPRKKAAPEPKPERRGGEKATPRTTRQRQRPVAAKKSSRR